MKITFKRNIILLISFLFLVLLLAIGIYLYSFKKPNQNLQENQQVSRNQVEKPTHTPTPCLSDDEIADFDYNTDLYNATGEKLPINATTTISIKNKTTNKEILNFTINDVAIKMYHSLEIHKCGVYVMRNFDLDQYKGLYKKNEIWRYTYDGNEEILLTNEDFFHPYNLEFRVDPSESFLVLQKFYPGHPDYGLVIKNPKDKGDVFVLLFKEITDKYSFLGGNFGFNEWTKDGRYFWGNIFDGANVLAFFRIEAGIWKWEIFEAPQGTMGGDALNPELGYTTYNTGAPWTGSQELNEEIKKQWQEQGKIASFYLYNLFTKKQILLATTTDPIWYFKPRWLSDTELQYYIPSGEKKVYKIEK